MKFDINAALKSAQEILKQNPYSVHPPGMAELLIQACNEIERLRNGLIGLRRGHSASKGCLYPLVYGNCTCGVDDYNREINGILEK